MPGFDDHIAQAKSNLNFLCVVNQQIRNYYDWQVTTCFYTAVHLVNAHLSMHGSQYRKHFDVNHALNPDVPISLTKLPEDEYDAYIALQILSRRSRYLVNEKDSQLRSTTAARTHDKHLAKATRHLNRLLSFFTGKYGFTVLPIDFKCVGLTQVDKLSYFRIS